MNGEQPSQSHANALLRVLKGEPRKFTCRVHVPGGEVIEFQSDSSPKVVWCDQARSLWLKCKPEGSYDYDVPIMGWREGAILLIEQNPGWKADLSITPP